jgi:hypothetical protein
LDYFWRSKPNPNLNINEKENVYNDVLDNRIFLNQSIKQKAVDDACVSDGAFNFKNGFSLLF